MVKASYPQIYECMYTFTYFKKALDHGPNITSSVPPENSTFNGIISGRQVVNRGSENVWYVFPHVKSWV